MKKLILTLLAPLTLWALAAQSSEPGRVLFLGTFHFKDAGKDVAKVEDIDIFTDENQAYLEALSSRLAAFGPDAVLLEYNPDNEDIINERYRQYLEGTFELPANEIYQLGFRIARHAGLERVHSFDHREVPWEARAVREYAESRNLPEWERYMAEIQDFVADEEQARQSMTLGELLVRHNDPANERLNRDLYLGTNVIGVDDGWSGADSTASWWKRNFRMYARVQNHAQPGKRVIAIGGSGHMAILKELLATDRRLEAEDPVPYLSVNPDR